MWILSKYKKPQNDDFQGHRQLSLTMLRVSASVVLQSHSFFGAAFSKYAPKIVLLKELEKPQMCSPKNLGNSKYCI